MVDVLAGSADTGYNKLDWSLSQSLPFHHSLSTRQLICPSPLTQETLRTVSSGAMYALILFINNFTRIDYAAQPNSSTRSFSTPSSIIRNKTFLTTARTQLDIDQKRLIEYFAVACLKELHADNEARGAPVRLAGLISPSFWSHQDHIEKRENKSKAVEDITASGNKSFFWIIWWCTARVGTCLHCSHTQTPT